MMIPRNMMEKFDEWKKVVFKTCPAKFQSGPLPPFCLIEGVQCCFRRCPRRVYQEDFHKEDKPIDSTQLNPGVQVSITGSKIAKIAEVPPEEKKRIES